MKSSPLLRELLGDLGGALATHERLRLAAWVRLLVLVPLVVVPTAVQLWGNREMASDPQAAAVVVGAWSTLAAAIVLSNVAILAWGSTRAARALTYVTLVAEIGTNVLQGHTVGVLTSSGGYFLLIVVAVYRVLFDYPLGRFAFLLGEVLLLALGLAEALALAPPLLPAAAAHPFHTDRGIGVGSTLVACAGMLVLFAMVNYGVNQAVKLHRYITESVLRRYLPPSLVARAAQGELRLDVPPTRRVVTVLFTDLVGFTAMSERLGAIAVGELLNRYLSMMADLAHAHGGTVDKFVGDAVMIVFGAPDPLEPAEQARRCVALAQDFQTRITELFPAEGEHEGLRSRTGINTGEVVVGNFGSLARSDYTVIGPTVNVAARLESASKPGRILVGEETARLLEGVYPLEPAGELTLKGVSRPVKAFFIGA